MSNPLPIKVKAMCLLVLDGHVLVADGNSMKSDMRPVEPSNFYRILGGSINFNESTEDAVRREIREELGIEIEDLQKLDVVENRFVYAGVPGHEIIFLYKGTPAKKDWDKTRRIHIIEDTYEFDAVWLPVSEFLSPDTTVFPTFNYADHLK
jgi:8-oxo-dGTP pyrophosphatase MutT (NUDIX family)